MDELKAYIENQFVGDVNWDNHDKLWHMHFVKPITEKNLIEEELLKRLHFSNIKVVRIKEIIKINGKEYSLNKIKAMAKRNIKCLQFREIVDDRVYFDRTEESFCDICKKKHGGTMYVKIMDKYDNCWQFCDTEPDDPGEFFCKWKSVSSL